MYHLLIGYFLTASLFLTPSSIFAEDVETRKRAINWAELAKADVLWALNVLGSSHPGSALNDADYILREKRAREAALSLAPLATDFNSYYFILRRLANSLQDVHVRVNPADINSLSRLKIRWPGFYVSFPDAQVHEGPVDGDILVSCDGKSLDELYQTNVLPYYGVPSLESSIVQWGPRMFMDLQLPWLTPPRSCIVDDDAGSKVGQSIEIDWREISFSDWLASAPNYIFGPAPKPELIQKSANTLWLRIPTLAPSREQAAIYQTMLKSAAFKSSKNIVFDLRGNGGGDTRWANAFIKASLSDEEARLFDLAREALSAVTVKYRVSQNNIDRIKAVSVNPVTGESDPGMAELAESLQESLEAGDDLFTLRQVDQPISEITAVVPNARAFFVITDGHCTSSCLAMMDRLKLFKKLVHMGWPTDADTRYLQINTLDFPKHAELPDVHFTFTYTMARYDRPWRGDNVPYNPHYLYSGKRWDQAGLESWAMDIIEKPRGGIW